jgi:hypothetical protein
MTPPHLPSPLGVAHVWLRVQRGRDVLCSPLTNTPHAGWKAFQRVASFKMKPRALCFGDTVFVSCKDGMVFAAPGGAAVRLETDAAMCYGCAFEIVPLLRYRAQELLLETEESRRQEDGTLLRKAQEEVLANEKSVEKARGQGVLFGAAVHFRHMDSGFYLSVLGNQVAKHDARNFSVGLAQLGPDALWTLGPLFNVHMEGDSLTSMDLVSVFSQKYRMYLQHVPHGAPHAGAVSASKSSMGAGWQLQLHAPFVETLPFATVHSGNMVQLFHKQSERFLAMEGSTVLFIQPDPKVTTSSLPHACARSR